MIYIAPISRIESDTNTSVFDENFTS